MMRLHPKFTVRGTNGGEEMVDSRHAEEVLDKQLRLVDDLTAQIVTLQKTRYQWAKELDAKEALLKEQASRLASKDFRIVELEEDVEALEAELKALKPPEPRFHVGQVVARVPAMYENLVCKIKETCYYSEPKKWWYRDYNGQWHKEDELRELTESER
jgi:hypothetical protein